MKKIILISVLLLLLGAGGVFYFLFLTKCPYEWGGSFKDWRDAPCPYIIQGKIFDWFTEKPIQGAQISLGDMVIHTGPDGKFLAKVRKEKLSEEHAAFVSKEKYLPAKFDFELPATEEEGIDLGLKTIIPAGRIIYQYGEEIHSINMNGTDDLRLADGALVAIGPKYDKFILKTADSALWLMDTEGKNEIKIAVEPDRKCGGSFAPNLTTLSYDETIVGWVTCYLSPGVNGKKELNEEVQYYSFKLNKQDNVRQIFRAVNNFRISSDGKYIALSALDFKNHDIFLLIDIENNANILQLTSGDVWTYFFDKNNFYYHTNSGWFTFNLLSGQTKNESSEPAWWNNKNFGILNPRSQDKLAVLKPGFYIKLTDQNGLNDKLTINIDSISKIYTSEMGDLMWFSREDYLLFKASDGKVLSLWLIDANSGKYKKIIDLSKATYINSSL